MLEITNLTHGEIVNCHYGKETDDGLTLDIQGIARSCDAVQVNGVPARRFGDAFSAPVTLSKRINDIHVEAIGDRGKATRDISVVWDKQSFKRTYFFIDDNIFFLTQIAHERPASLFDQFYLKMLKRLHDLYDFKVTLNLFYRNDHNPFELSEFPDIYRSEFQANKDWLRLAFHGYSEFPDRPYQNARPGKLGADYDLIGREVERFAGPGVFTPPVVCHWAMCQPFALKEMRDRGVKEISAHYIGGQTFIGELISDIPVCDIGFFQSEENARFLTQRHLWYDFRHELSFLHSGLCCNLQEIPELTSTLDELFETPSLDVIYGMTHEQYFYKDYANYLPNHPERIEMVVRLMHEHGYKFIWPNEGLLGNTNLAPM